MKANDVYLHHILERNFDVDIDEVWKIIENDLRKLQSVIKEILKDSQI